MEIELKKGFGFELVFKNENITFTEDVESREYKKNAEGKTIYSNPKRDIKTGVLQQFSSILDDLIYYREEEFDSSELIVRLFEKLPAEIAEKLSIKLECDYSNNDK